MTAFAYTLTSLTGWAGPINAGTGCLSCVTHCVRGRAVWFDRGANPHYIECLDPLGDAPSYEVALFYAVGGAYTSRASGSCGPFGEGTSVDTAVVDYYEGHYDNTTFTLFRATCDPEETVVTPYGFLHAGPHVGFVDSYLYWQFADPGTTGGSGWVPSSNASIPEALEPGGSNNVGDYFDKVVALESSYDYYWGEFEWEGVTYRNRDVGELRTVTGYREVGSVTEIEATQVVEDAADDADTWGADAEAQFPQIACPGPAYGEGAMNPNSCDISNPSTVVYEHTKEGRRVFRGKLSVSQAYYGPQVFSIKWDRVLRKLGYDAVRLVSASGSSSATRSRSLTLTELMAAPEDASGSLAFDSATWAQRGYEILDVPTTGVPFSSGFLAADLATRSRVRFAVREQGVFSFQIRKVEKRGDGSLETTNATLSTDGSIADDGTNSTDSFDVAPSDRLSEVRLFVVSAPAVQWMALGKVRQGALGFRQLNHATLQADSLFYRKRAFTQTTTITSTYAPAEGETDCSESDVPWMDFNQTQTWEQVMGAPDWTLASASGSCGGVSWTDEVTVFDPPNTALGVPPGVATWTQTETAFDGFEGHAYAAIFDRVVPTANPFFGGKILSVAEQTSVTTPATYASATVQQTATIYAYAGVRGTGVQIVNVRVHGA